MYLILQEEETCLGSGIVPFNEDEKEKEKENGWGAGSVLYFDGERLKKGWKAGRVPYFDGER